MYIPGHAAKLLLNNVRYAFSSIQLEETVDVVRTSNSEGNNSLAPATWLPGAHTQISGNGQFSITINTPSYDTTANWFLPPFTIGAGLFCSCQVLLNGPGSVSWFCASLHITATGQNIDAQGTGGQPLYARGAGNGNWLRPIA
jgi:hypothetical protein